MKKILSIFFLLGIATPSFAQEETKSETKGFSFGLKAAPGIGWFKPETQKQTSNGAKFNFSYGIMTEFNFTDNYSLATGLEINHIKGSTRQTNVLGEVSNTTKIQYLMLPLTIKMKTKEIGAMKYFGQFGLGSSYALKSKADITTNYSGVVTTQNDLAADTSIAMIKESLLIGLGVEYNLVGSTSAVFSVMYDNGFTNLNSKDVRRSLSYPGKLTNKAIVATIGILF